MKVLPIAERELRVASRRRGTYWVRFAAGALVLVAASIVQLWMLREPPLRQGQMQFTTLVIVSFVFCLLSGVLTTADCVSEEKRDGTLGLLFLTNLRGFDVVIGKWVANSVRAVLSLLALLPILWLPVLMGGVSGEAALCAAAVLLNTMFLSLAIGVLVSVAMRDARHAVGGTIFVLFVILAVLPLIRWLLIEYAMAPALRNPGTRGIDNSLAPLGWMLLVNPCLPLAGTLEVLFRGGKPQPILFWEPLVVQHALAWLALILSCILLPRVWQDRVSKCATRALTTPLLELQRQARAEFLDKYPFSWVVVRDRRPRMLTWAGLGLIAICWIWGFAETKDEWLQGFIGLWTLFFAAFWLKVRLCSASCRYLHEQRRSGALELVLCTSLAPREIIHGNLMGLWKTIMNPLGAVLGATVLLMLAALQEARGSNAGKEMMVAFLVGVGVLLLDLWTIAWAGMWHGLRSQRYVRAYAQTLGWVMALPWALFIVSLIVPAALFQSLRIHTSFEPTFVMVVLWWALISLAVDAWILFRATRGLQTGLRELAAESYAPLKTARKERPASGTPMMRPA